MEKNRFNDLTMRKEILSYGPVGNLRDIVDRCANMYGNNILFSEKKDGIIMSYGALKLKEDVEALGTKLIEMGMKDSHIAIIGENSYNWVVSFFAAAAGCGVAVPIDKELPDEEIIRMLNKGDVDVVFCSDTYIPVMIKHYKEVNKLKWVIGFDKIPEKEGFYNIKTLIKDGRKLVRKKNRDYIDAVIDNDALAVLVFTSGTTGANKGVMLSHKNLATTVNIVVHDIVIGETAMSILPLHHTYELGCTLLGGMYLGTRIYFNDSLKYLMSNMELYRPQVMCMVPLFLETIYKGIWQESERLELKRYLKQGLLVSRCLSKVGIDVRRKFFKPVLAKFGGRVERIMCGGAPIREDIARGLSEFGINITNGFGITECAPLIAINQNVAKDPKTVGKAVYGVDVRIDEADSTGCGEIVVKGDNVMIGYYKDEESTKLSFTKDGYFKTGDYGMIDKNGRITITGRKKNLIILENGKNVYPEEIENEILTSVPYVKEVIVYAENAESADERGIIAAKMVFDQEYISQNDINDADMLIHEDIKRVNKKLPSYKHIHHIDISQNEFVKTTTRKIKRKESLETDRKEEVKNVG